VKETRILIVDDSLTIRKLAERVLAKEGYVTELAETMEDALSKVPLFKPDLILLDYILPDGHGTDVCRSLVKTPATAHIPILMISAKGADIRKLYIDLPNVVDFLTKPFTPVVLTSVVEHVLEGGRKPLRPERTDRGDSGGQIKLLPTLAALVAHHLDDFQWKEIPSKIRHAMGSIRVESFDPAEKLLLSGSTRLVPLDEVLAACEKEGVTGRIEIAGNSGLDVVAWLEDGRICYSIPRRSFFETRRVAGHLEGISRHALDEAEKQQEAGRRSGLSYLVDRGMLDKETARVVAREIALASLLENMEGTDSRFRVLGDGDRPEEYDAFGFDLDIDKIKMERLRRTDAWHMIEASIPSLDVTMVRSRNAERLSARLSLTPLESKILGLVNGTRTVQEIVDIMNSTAFEVCRVLYRLVGAEVIRIKQRRGDIEGHEARRVLIIDTDREDLCPAITEILSGVFSGLEIRCVTGNFNRIPYIIKIFQPDTILMEVHLPGFDTTKLVKLLRHSGEFQSVRIIGMATDIDDAEVRQLYRIGFNGFLPKPFLPEQLTAFFVHAEEDNPSSAPGEIHVEQHTE